jgi:hypothetical protein
VTDITVVWFGIKFKVNGPVITTSHHMREFTEEEYAAMGGSAAVCRKLMCPCPSVTVDTGRWRYVADHAKAAWSGSVDGGDLNLTVSAP